MRSIGRSTVSPAAVAATAMPFLTRAAALTLVVILPLVVSPWGEDGYNQVKALTTLALAALALLGWVGTRLTSRLPRWTFTAPEIAVWGVLLAVLLSTATSVDAMQSFFGAPGRYEGLFAYCAYVALFFVGVHFFGSHVGFRSLAAAAGVAAMVTIGYAVLQLFLPPLFAGEAFIRTWYGGLGVPRIPSTLGSPVVFGGYLSLMLPVLLALAVLAGGRPRVLWLAAAGVGYGAAVLTLTRAAWAGIVAGSCLFAVILRRDLWPRHRSVLAVVSGAVILAALVLALGVGSPAQVAERITSSVDISSGSLGTRLYMWRQTLGLVRARPWLGWGLETLGQVFPYDRPALVKLFGVRPVIVDKAHNDILQMAVSVGVPGALAYGAVWAGVAIAAVRLAGRESGSARVLAVGWLAAVVAYLVQVQFSFSAVALAPLVWLLAGAACGWEASPGLPSSPGGKSNT